MNQLNTRKTKRRRRYRFTESWLTRLKAPTDREQVEYWDESVHGLHVVVRKTGRKSYYVRRNGRRKKLGDVIGDGAAGERRLAAGKAITLKEARARAEATYPQKTSAPQMRVFARARKVETVRDLYGVWRSQRAPELRPNTRKEYIRSLERDTLPHFGPFSPSEISPDEVLGWMESIGDRPPLGLGKPSAANHAKAYFGAMMGWGAKKGLIKHDPVAAVKWRYAEAKKRNVYQQREIATLWRDWCGRGGFGVRVFKLVLCTIQRPGEVMEMQWGDIETIRGQTLWRIAGEDTKNNNTHFVPLEPLALETLEELRPISGSGKWVFPHHHDATRPMVSYNAEMRKCRERTGIQRFDVHSLRRTGASWMETLGVELPVIQAVLNHAKPGATGHYVFAQGASPVCREALRVWEDHIRACLAL